MKLPLPFSAFYCLLLAQGGAVEEWKYDTLADITRLNNLVQGAWDEGLNGSFMKSAERGKKRMSPELQAFLLKRIKASEKGRMSLALYLAMYQYRDCEDLWMELIDLASRDKELHLKVRLQSGPLRHSEKVLMSIADLHGEVERRNGD